jgi:hypothetical protein
MSELSIGERWARRIQPVDERAALIEVVAFLNVPDNLHTYTPEAEQDDFERKFCVSRESVLLGIEYSAVNIVNSYLDRKPKPWQPGMRKPGIPWFVLLPVMWRASSRCEECGSGGQINLENHHLHYRTVGCERPSDLELLCRRCHDTWQDCRELESIELE